ncbi:sensor histidine kinase [Metaclostridioides mangenotii]
MSLALFVIVGIISNRFTFFKNFSFMKKACFSAIISIASTILISKIYNNIFDIFRGELFLLGQFLTILTIISILMCIYIGFKFLSLLENLNEQDFNLEKQENKLEHKDNIIAKLRSQKHDYLKHLQIVFSLINTDLIDDAKEYIKNISNSFKTQKSRYGNVSYIDAIAALKYEECLLKNIKFDMYIQDFIDNLSIPPNEMSSVLINIIDNAIDALSTVSKENKYIKIFIYEDEFQYVISIKNNGPKIYNTKGIFEEGFSTKDGKDRGYGLFAIKNILEKYGYYIFVNSDEFLTEFTILIPKYI